MILKFDGWEVATDNSLPLLQKDLHELPSFSAYAFLHLTIRLIMELTVKNGIKWKKWKQNKPNQKKTKCHEYYDKF